MKKLLFIEDDKALRAAIREKLNQSDVKFLEAKNGTDGLEIALNEHPDLILLDIVLPQLGGFSMLEKLRKDPWGKGAEVIILTNLSDSEYVSDSLNNEVYEFIVKAEVKLDGLIKKIKLRLGIK